MREEIKLFLEIKSVVFDKNKALLLEGSFLS
jgi:hypothetical protein